MLLSFCKRYFGVNKNAAKKITVRFGVQRNIKPGYNEESMTDFSKLVIDIIKAVPPGKVASYGRIAEIAGNPRAARQVSRLLHSSSDKHDLPWQRIVGGDGSISLKGEAGLIQRGLLESEGIEFGLNGRIDMDRFSI